MLLNSLKPKILIFEKLSRKILLKAAAFGHFNGALWLPPNICSASNTLKYSKTTKQYQKFYELAKKSVAKSTIDIRYTSPQAKAILKQWYGNRQNILSHT